MGMMFDGNFRWVQRNWSSHKYHLLFTHWIMARQFFVFFFFLFFFIAFCLVFLVLSFMFFFLSSLLTVTVIIYGHICETAAFINVVEEEKDRKKNILIKHHAKAIKEIVAMKIKLSNDDFKYKCTYCSEYLSDSLSVYRC